MTIYPDYPEPFYYYQPAPYQPAPMWTVQRCPVCDAKGYVWSGIPTLDKCSFCDGKKAVLVSAMGTVQRISNVMT